ncbi:MULTISPECIES: hypothetical protein [Streptomyces]|uniref:Uncharacterized protein n=1 Tax=Streptomyces fimbriatus TaxID=68197 RepID=A0ABW0DKB9_STRFI
MTAAVADAIALRTAPAGPVPLPMAAITAVLAVLSGVVALARPAAARRAGLRALILAPYAVVRHGLLAPTNLALIVAGLLPVNQAS